MPLPGHTYTYSVDTSPEAVENGFGSLPSGLIINTDTGEITGTPEVGTTGAHPVRFKIIGQGSAVNGVTPPAYEVFVEKTIYILDGNIPNPAMEGRPINGQFVTLETEGKDALPGTYTLTQEILDLPASASYGSAGEVFSGAVTPDADNVTTTYKVQIVHTVTYADPVTGRTVTETITQSEKDFVVLENLILTGALPNGTENVAYTSPKPTVTGGQGPYTFAAEGIPAGLSLDSETGVLSGTPTESGSKNIIYTVTDSYGYTATATMPLTINVRDTVIPVITQIPDQVKIEGQPIDEISVKVSEPAELTVEGLPEGVTFNTETRLINGTPAPVTWADGQEEVTYTVIVTAKDPSGNQGNETFTITVQRDANDNGVADIRETLIYFNTDGNGTLSKRDIAPDWTQQQPVPGGDGTVWQMYALKGDILENIKAPTVTGTNLDYTGFVWKINDTTINLTDVVIESGTYTAIFNKNIIEYPENPTVPVPDGYVRLEFIAGEQGAFQTGEDPDIKVVDVLIGTDYEEVRSVVYDPIGDPGYTFRGWDRPIPSNGTQVTAGDNTNFIAQYLPTIIENPTDEDPPEGYTRITFRAEGPGQLQSFMQDSSFIGPIITYDIKDTLTFGDVTDPTQIPIPIPIPDGGAGFIDWLPPLPYPGQVVGQLTDTTFVAYFGADIIPADPDTEPPFGYHRVVFDSGDYGSFTEGIEDIHLDVRNGVPFDQLLPWVPETDLMTINNAYLLKPAPNTWGPQLPEPAHTGEPYYANETYVVQYVAKAKSPSPVITQPVVGDTTISGTGISGAEIKITIPGFTDPVITTVGPDGKWSVDVPADITLEVDDVISANQTSTDTLPSDDASKTVLDKIIPATPTNPDPNRYVKITFDSGLSGNFGGAPVVETKEYFVLKDGTVPVTDVFSKAGLNATNATGITIVGDYNFDKWEPITSGNVTGTTTYTAKYVAKTPSLPPTIDPPVVGDTTITGTGIDGATITVTVPWSGTPEEVVVTDGKWSIDVPAETPLKADDEIGASQTQVNQLPSTTVTAIVTGILLPVENPDETVPEKYHRVVFHPGEQGAFAHAPSYNIATGSYAGQVHFNVLNGVTFDEVKAVMPQTANMTVANE